MNTIYFSKYGKNEKTFKIVSFFVEEQCLFERNCTTTGFKESSKKISKLVLHPKRFFLYANTHIAVASTVC